MTTARRTIERLGMAPLSIGSFDQAMNARVMGNAATAESHSVRSGTSAPFNGVAATMNPKITLISGNGDQIVGAPARIDSVPPTNTRAAVPINPISRIC